MQEPTEPNDLDALSRRLAVREERTDRLSRTWLQTPASSQQRWFAIAWALAIVVRCTLPEAQTAGWWTTHLVLLGCASGILRHGGRIFWAVSALALLIGLHTLGDWLTQTVVLFSIATAAAVSPNHAPRIASRLVAATYLIAAFHKLNAGFFDPSISCASDGWLQFDAATRISIGDPTAALPVLIITTEVALGLMLLWRPIWALAIGAAFHIPMTLVLAPSFAFALAPGYVGALSDEDRQRLQTITPTKIAACAALCAAATFIVAPGIPVLMAMKIAFLGSVGLLAASMAVGRQITLGNDHSSKNTTLGHQSKITLGHDHSVHRWLPTIAITLFVAHAMGPYIRTQFQHTGAMLSNLRVDNGCWNHFVVPEPPWLDDYVRIEAASVGGTDADGVENIDALESLLVSRLWSATALRTMRRNWCAPHTTPIRLDLIHRGQRSTIEDLCTATDLPAARGVLGFGAISANLLRFQKRLERTCTQACMH